MESLVKGIATTLQVVLVGAVVIWDIWAIVVAFAGGWLPVPWLWYTEGGIWFGLLWLFVIAPVLTGVAATVLSWTLGLLAAPFIAASQRRS